MKAMGETQEEYYRGVRMVPYDLVKELVLALAGVGILAIAVSAILSSPDVPPTTIAAWAQADPVDFVTTATGELAGSTTSAGYGNPYNTNGSGQAWGPIAPQTWFGTRIPIDSADTFVIQPLERGASSNTDLGTLVGSTTGDATLAISTEVPKIEGGFLCPNPSRWTANYTVTSPTPLHVTEK